MEAARDARRRGPRVGRHDRRRPRHGDPAGRRLAHRRCAACCDNARNLSDAHARGIAATGGVVGIGFWPTACGGDDVAAIARSIRYAVDVAGVEHVALGSDFDGAVPVPFDATGLVRLTDALLDDGLDDDAIATVMGGNVRRLLADTLPDTPGSAAG